MIEEIDSRFKVLSSLNGKRMCKRAAMWETKACSMKTVKGTFECNGSSEFC
jgi:hypothetical protein